MEFWGEMWNIWGLWTRNTVERWRRTSLHFWCQLLPWLLFSLNDLIFLLACQGLQQSRGFDLDKNLTSFLARVLKILSKNISLKRRPCVHPVFYLLGLPGTLHGPSELTFVKSVKSV